MDKLLNIKNFPISFVLVNVAHDLFLFLLDLLSPCPIGIWQEAAMLIVVAKHMSMSQSVDQMGLHTLTLVWLAVLIAVILALGWVYFTNSSSVVSPASCDKDVLEFLCKYMTSVSLCKKLQITAKYLLTKMQRKENHSILSFFFPGMIGAFGCSDLVPCQPSSTLHSVPAQWNLIRLSAMPLNCYLDRALVMDLKVKKITVGADCRE